MHISPTDQLDADIDYFATDAAGHILHVASSGGVLLGSVAADEEALLALHQYFLTRPEPANHLHQSTAPRHSPRPIASTSVSTASTVVPRTSMSVLRDTMKVLRGSLLKLRASTSVEQLLRLSCVVL